MIDDERSEAMLEDSRRPPQMPACLGEWG